MWCKGFLYVQLREREWDITFRTEWCYWLGSWRGTLPDSSRIVLFYPAKSLKKMKFPLTRNSDFFCEMEWAVLSKPLFLQLFCTRRKGITAGGKLCVCVLWLAHQSVVVQCKCSASAVQTWTRCGLCGLQSATCDLCDLCDLCVLLCAKEENKGKGNWWWGSLSLGILIPTPHLQSHYGRLLGMYKVLNISQRIRNSFPPGKIRLLSWNPFRTFLYWWGPLILKFLLLIWHWALALASIVLNSFEMW